MEQLQDSPTTDSTKRLPANGIDDFRLLEEICKLLPGSFEYQSTSIVEKRYEFNDYVNEVYILCRKDCKNELTIPEIKAYIEKVKNSGFRVVCNYKAQFNQLRVKLDENQKEIEDNKVILCLTKHLEQKLANNNKQKGNHGTEI